MVLGREYPRARAAAPQGECLLAEEDLLLDPSHMYGMLGLACNPSTQEAEARGSEVQRCPKFQRSEFEASLGK